MARSFTINDAAAWERQTGESDESWEAFVLYRDMPAEGDGRRSTRAVARQLGKDRTLIGRWSAGHQWQLRVQAFDREQDARPARRAGSGLPTCGAPAGAGARGRRHRRPPTGGGVPAKAA